MVEPRPLKGPASPCDGFLKELKDRAPEGFIVVGRLSLHEHGLKYVASSCGVDPTP